MTDRTGSEVVKVGPAEVPAWLAPHMEQDNSLAKLSEFRVLGRLALIAATSDDELKERHGEGSIVLFPMDITLSQKGGDAQGVTVTPVFFWNDFVQYSDRRDQNNPNVMEQSFDETSELAQRCRDKDRRAEEYPGGPKGKPFISLWVERLHFACVIRDGDMAGEQVGLTFQKGEFFNGKKFCTSIGSRRVPLWAQCWRLTSSLRPPNNDGNQWYGFDFAEAGFIEPEEADLAKALFAELEGLHKKNNLGIAEETEAGVVGSDAGDDDGEM